MVQKLQSSLFYSCFLYVLLFSLFSSVPAASQSTPETGEVLLISANFKPSPYFEAVTLVPLEKETQLFLSNSPWNSKTNSFEQPEQFVIFRLDKNVEKGSIMEFSEELLTNLSLSFSEDVLFLYRMDENGNPVFLHAVSWQEKNARKWKLNSGTDLPKQLDDASIPIPELSGGNNHQYFVRNGASGTIPMLQQFIGNSENWRQNPSRSFPRFGTSFTILNPPVVMFSQTASTVSEKNKSIVLQLAVFGHDGSEASGIVRLDEKNSTLERVNLEFKTQKSFSLKGVKNGETLKIEFPMRPNGHYDGDMIGSFVIDSLSIGNYGDYRTHTVLIRESDMPLMSAEFFHSTANGEVEALKFRNMESIDVDVSDWKLQFQKKAQSFPKGVILKSGQEILLQFEKTLSRESIPAHHIFDFSGFKNLSNGEVRLINSRNELVWNAKIEKPQKRDTPKAEPITQRPISGELQNQLQVMSSVVSASPLNPDSQSKYIAPGWYRAEQIPSTLLGNTEHITTVWDHAKGRFVVSEKGIPESYTAAWIWLNDTLFVDSGEFVRGIEPVGETSFLLEAPDVNANSTLDETEGFLFLRNPLSAAIEVEKLKNAIADKASITENDVDIFYTQTQENGIRFEQFGVNGKIQPGALFGIKLYTQIEPTEILFNEIDGYKGRVEPQRQVQEMGKVTFRLSSEGEEFPVEIVWNENEKIFRFVNLNAFDALWMPAAPQNSFAVHFPDGYFRRMEIPFDLEQKLDFDLVLKTKNIDEWLFDISEISLPSGVRVLVNKKESSDKHDIFRGFSEVLLPSFNRLNNRYEARISVSILPSGYVESEEEIQKPASAELYQNYPNPFNPSTTISFMLPESSRVKLAVYNIVGQMVTLLIDGDMSKGEHSVDWDASQMPSGIYIVQLEVANKVMTQKMTLLK